MPAGHIIVYRCPVQLAVVELHHNVLQIIGYHSNDVAILYRVIMGDWLN